MSVKAIETRYKGYRFRSRLEARWAVFLDSLGVAWEYEKEGYRLPSGLYLPDFWLPGIACWLEIKPIPPSGREEKLLLELAAATESLAYLFYGPVPGYAVDLEGIGTYSDSAHCCYCDGCVDYGYAFCVCPNCGQVGIEFEGRSDRLACKECYACAWARRGTHPLAGAWSQCPYEHGCQKRCPRTGGNLDRGHTFEHSRILVAVEAARSARFEHGETPR